MWIEKVKKYILLNISVAPKKNERSNVEYKKVEDIIELATGEIVLKDYYAANVRKPSYGEAHFAITNKRLIWYIWSEETVKVNSVNIVDIVSTSIYKTETSFAIIINIRAATGAFTFSTYPHSILEKGLSPEKLDLEAYPGPDMDLMARELGALILNMRKIIRESL